MATGHPKPRPAITIEAIDRYCSRSMRRQGKRDLARARRRAERRDPEGAGTSTRHFIRGWLL